MVPITPLTLVLLATIVIGVAATLTAWRARPEPGSFPLVAMLAGQSWWSICLVLQIQATTLHEKLFWVAVSWLGVVVIPVGWLAFALDYTGRDKYLQPQYLVLASLIPAITVILTLTGEYHDLLYRESTLIVQNGAFRLDQSVGPWFWVITGYTYLLGLLGSIPIFGMLTSEMRPFRGQSVALLLGTLAPWASNVFYLLGIFDTSGLDPTPVAFSVSGVAYLAAVTRFRLFGASPSPTHRARRLVFTQMHDGAVVVDRHDTIVDMNEPAEDILGTNATTVLGMPSDSIIPSYDELPVDGEVSEPISIETSYGTDRYDVSVTRIDDVHGRFLGCLISFHDVSEILRERQRLKVLNRVLRHNLRTEANLISGYADLVADTEGTSESQLIKKHTQRIIDVGDKGRAIVDLFETNWMAKQPRSVPELLDACVTEVAKTYPDARISTGNVSPDIVVSPVLKPVLVNLIENGVEHNANDEPWVQISTRIDDTTVEFQVIDDGDGIGEYEREVLEHGDETPLEHGSGLGLWLVRWGVDIADGELRFENRQTGGSVVTVRVPRLSVAERN
ncbi:PAS domain S-box protein [Haloferax mediterranei ATCC 33500]|uniref:histidine kinase n=1 Tax=Haloferax mediterranei (strain ATCC 33500 / DSM 1411 / JCM 8866 / NBRC 14739 / NCIMB 2177 / R-4) TaxID=523841 RepID=I3R252_HALMT|nr:histidine kinase N-terminal 7TM domain-containing protein [Haloferax mediterranei]AFK18312.1 putative signal-transducing histidine kinase [Haloferax mediterranei ATCC 33500]AHZ22290.1 diguanylate cyclase [Haloferax mediterranei ATCC 33500]EMA02417.1 putative signal-transducing histidine kinase [Haloferax mediterranei ATCC 33500]MDX5988400.1 histidine kinase N-terminal 7TM domain-containing protein [Haloferax mediterranei ATCC 33500]QCQ74827.1 PAS domain S-box protein [Haloferax mediterranei